MKKHIILLFAITLSFNLSAQEKMGVEEYKQKVLEYSLKIKQSKEGVIMAESDLSAAKKNLLPKLDAAAEFSYLLNKINFDIGSGQMIPISRYNYGVSATVAQNVYSGGAVRKQIDALKINRDISQKQVELTIENITYLAELYYWKSIAMINYRDVATDYLKIIKETYDVVSTRYDDGLISRNDLLMIETRLAEAEYGLKDMQKSLQSALIEMNTLMGVPPETKVFFKDSLLNRAFKAPFFQTLDEAFANRPEYAISQKQVDAALQSLRITKSQYLPKLAVGVTGQYATPTINITGDGMLNAVAFAQLRVPIFNWNERRYKVLSSEAKIRSSEYNMTNTIDEITNEVSISWSHLTNTYEQLALAKRSLSIAQQSLDLNTYSYTEGVLTILDVLSSQLSWLNAYNDLITTNFKYLQAEAAYKKAMGTYY